MSDEVTVEVTTDDNGDNENGIQSVTEQVENAVDTKVESDQSFQLGALTAKVAELEEKADSAVTMAAAANERIDAIHRREEVESAHELADERVKDAEEKVEELQDAIEDAADDGVITPDEVEYIEEVAEDSEPDDDAPKVKPHFLFRTWGKG